jgi:acyl-CoA thioesterase I
MVPACVGSSSSALRLNARFDARCRYQIEEAAMMSVVKSVPRMLLAAAIAFSVQVPGANAETAVRIVALGASNTDGWGVDRSEAYPAQLQTLLRARGIDATVRNAGMPGDTTGGMLARLGGWLADDVRLVILQPGTNDERMGLGAERASNIAKIRAELEARNVKLIVIENSVLDALPRTELRGDNIHFTPAGYAVLAERILPDVLTALGKR